MFAAMDPNKLIEHVKDSPEFHLPGGWHPALPEVFGFQLTKFMVLEVVAGLLMLALFVPLAWKIRGGRPPKGKLWNMLEVMLVFLRDEVARPAIGKKDADRFLPFLWTMFFFILFGNLLGLVPWAGSPTGELAVTATLAVATLVTVLGGGMMKYGFAGFWTGLVPEMGLPIPVAIFIWPMIFVLEVAGLFIRHFVLSMRLLANMFAGHLILAVLLHFIVMAAQQHVAIWAGVMVGSVFGAAMFTILEIFVAFLQAYIFTFLSALFIGMAVHQH